MRPPAVTTCDSGVVTQQLLVPTRFRGPPSSGNGGWTSGALAVLLTGPGPGAFSTVEVTLRQPPPLERGLPVTVAAGTATCAVAEAAVVEREPAAVEPVTMAQAAAAEASFAGLRRHPFPTCFSCGPGRAPGDGLRIFPGRVADSGRGGRRVAATWTPDPSVAAEGAGPAHATVPITWAALDCIGGWSGDLEERPMVLGRMTARVDTLPAIGAPHVLVGELLGEQGRKTYSAATLYDDRGRVLARAAHVWIAVDPATFG